MSTDTDRRTDPATQVTSGRPRILVARVPRQTAAVAVLVTLVVFAALSIGIGGLLPTVFGLGTGVVLAVSLAVLTLEDSVRAVVGGGLLLTALASAFGGSVWFGVTIGSVSGGVAVAGVLVGYGLALFRVNGYGDGAIARAMAWVARVALVVTVTGLVVLPFVADVSRLLAVSSGIIPVDQLVAPRSTGTAVAGFVSLSWLAFAGVWLVSVTVPLQAIVDEQRVERFDSLRSRVLRIGGAVLGIGSIVFALGYAASVETANLGGIGMLFTLLVESTVVRLWLLRIVFAGLGVTVGLGVIRQAGGALVGSRLAWIPSALLVTAAIVAGGHLAGSLIGNELAAVIGEASLLSALVEVLGPIGIGVVGGVTALVGGILVLSLGPVLDALGLFSERTVGPRLVLVGVVSAGVLVLLADGSAVLAFAGIVGGVVAWDIADHGAALRSDIGTGEVYQWGGFVHAGSSVLIGGVTLSVGMAFNWLYFGAGIPLTGSVVTALVAISAITVLVVVSRS